MTRTEPARTVGNVVVSGFIDADCEPWEGFVASQPQATFFHRAGWREVIEQGLGHRTHYLLARMDGLVVGVLPLAEISSRLFGHRLVSVPGCVYGGALASTTAAEAALIDAACALADRLQVQSLELRNLTPVARDWPTQPLYVTFRRTLSADDGDNLKAIPRKQRAMVRKGLEAGLTTALSDDVQRFWRVYAEGVRNLGTPVLPLRYFRALMRVFRDDMELALVQHGGADIAAVMSFYFRDEVLPYYGGSRPAARGRKANDYMYWDLMCRAVRRGVRVFDYGRSKVGSGSWQFKKNWGFEPQPLAYQYYLVGAGQLPELNPNNPKYRLLIAAWQRLPLPIANTLGPLLAPDLA